MEKAEREMDSPGAVLKPAPRDLTYCQFQDKRSDDELFWVIKNGSPGTGMIALIPGALNEEEAWKVIVSPINFRFVRSEKMHVPGFGPAAEVLLFRQKDPKPCAPSMFNSLRV